MAVLPGSSIVGRAEAFDLMLRIDPEPETILDIGPGAGQWLPGLRQWFPDASIDAIEIFAPYVERYELDRRYDSVIVGDARRAAETASLKSYDLLICGDVLEHMTQPEAQAMLSQLMWRYAILSIPLGPCPQEPTEENPFEEHVSTWEIGDVLMTFPVVGPYFVREDPATAGRRGVFLCERTVSNVG